jgi:hypothetical protein
MIHQLMWALGPWGIILAVRWHTLTYQCYLHVRKAVKGDEAAAYKAQRTRERQLRGKQEQTGGLYQPTLIKAAHPGRHVILSPYPWWFLLPIRPCLRGAWIRWTADAHTSPVLFDDLCAGVADFLGLGHDPGQVEHGKPNNLLKLVHIIRVRDHATPDRLPYDSFPGIPSGRTSEVEREWDQREVG